MTATDLDTLDHALSQVEDRDQVIICVLTSILIEEAHAVDVSVSASNLCSEVVTRLQGVCPRSPSCQVALSFVNWKGFVDWEDFDLYYSMFLIGC